jgi:hypothetical protein
MVNTDLLQRLYTMVSYSSSDGGDGPGSATGGCGGEGGGSATGGCGGED